MKNEGEYLISWKSRNFDGPSIVPNRVQMHTATEGNAILFFSES